MATNATWTVIFDDKTIRNQTGPDAGTYKINDDAFWNQAKFSNIWAIQYQTPVDTDQVEYRDETPHSTYDSNVLGNFQEFINRWDSAHLAQLQSDWDNNNVDSETEAEKIARLGARPTSYSS